MKRIALFLFFVVILALGVLGYLGLEKANNPVKTAVAEKAEQTAATEQAASGKAADAKAERPAIQQGSEQKGETGGWTPNFDVVRVEKNGETLIAGQGAPNAQILIESNGRIVAETRADETGAFVAIPSEPFRGENNAVVIRSIDDKGNETVSDQVVAIGVPEKGEALVALVEPGKAVSILQKPTATAENAVTPPSQSGQAPQTAVPGTPDRSQVTAIATPPAVPADEKLATVSPGAADGASGSSAEVPATPTPFPSVAAAQKETEKASENATQRTVQNGAQAAGEETRRIARLVKPDDASAASTKEGEPTGAAGEGRTDVAPAEAKTEATGTSDPSSPPTIVSTVAAPPAQADPAVPIAAPQVTVEAVEVDGEKLFIAGAAVPGSTVRVYIDGEAVGDVKAGENGRWLFDQSRNLTSGDHAIRADTLDPSSGAVTARAEVPFVVEERALADIPAATGGTIIIRRNDNLWTIAKRLYGDGLRYTAIYQQNRDQIRNPDLIYPGQTFTLPSEETLKNEAN
ncbi:MAG: LysM peptidoglycan-binding domain-containing protein [Rhizobiales bacterium]|nr:LysM peptidoglycan-binding domain-containing protein [Hyphomicrobiales bacterium]